MPVATCEEALVTVTVYVIVSPSSGLVALTAFKTSISIPTKVTVTLEELFVETESI